MIRFPVETGKQKVDTSIDVDKRISKMIGENALTEEYCTFRNNRDK